MQKTAQILSLWVPPLALMALIFLLSDQPNLNSGLGVWDTILRKLAHMTEFGLLTALFYRALKASNDALKSNLLIAVFLSFFYANGDEVHQGLVAGRHAAVTDVLIDLVGVALAVIVIVLQNRRRPT